jgi:hypothetical protein
MHDCLVTSFLVVRPASNNWRCYKVPSCALARPVSSRLVENRNVWTRHKSPYPIHHRAFGWRYLPGDEINSRPQELLTGPTCSKILRFFRVNTTVNTESTFRLEKRGLIPDNKNFMPIFQLKTQPGSSTLLSTYTKWIATVTNWWTIAALCSQDISCSRGNTEVQNQDYKFPPLTHPDLHLLQSAEILIPLYKYLNYSWVPQTVSSFTYFSSPHACYMSPNHTLLT